MPRWFLCDQVRTRKAHVSNGSRKYFFLLPFRFYYCVVTYQNQEVAPRNMPWSAFHEEVAALVQVTSDWPMMGQLGQFDCVNLLPPVVWRYLPCCDVLCWDIKSVGIIRAVSVGFAFSIAAGQEKAAGIKTGRRTNWHTGHGVLIQKEKGKGGKEMSFRDGLTFSWRRA